MNVARCREVEYINPFKFKERTKERGEAWEDVAANLKKHGFEVTKRSVRDKYKSLKDSVTKRNSKELKESGISPEFTDEQSEDCSRRRISLAGGSPCSKFMVAGWVRDEISV